MIIAFDTLLLSSRYRHVGIYEYAKHLFGEFANLVASSNSVTIRFFVTPGRSEDFVAKAGCKHFEPVTTRLLLVDRLWRMGLVNYAAKAAGANLVFCPAPKIFPLGVPAAVTIHDVMPVRIPELIGRRSACELTAQYWLAAKSSEILLTDSEYSKKDIMRAFGVPAAKIHVVHLGYDAAHFNDLVPDVLKEQALLRRLGLNCKYIIHHGMLQARKNLSRLIRAYEIASQRLGAREFSLVLVGSPGRGFAEIQDAAQKVKKGKVIFAGGLSDEELGILLKKASLSVIPSIYEGFCLPMVEAMACGVPTIAADNSCMPEISGGALRYFDPFSEEQMASAITDVLRDSDLQALLARKGLKRAAEFSWQRCARETFAVLSGTGSTASSALVPQG